MIKAKLFPCFKYCKNCFQVIWKQSLTSAHDEYFYCEQCQVQTKWSYNTKLARIQISYTQLEKLLSLYVNRNSVQSAYDFLSSDYIEEELTKNTIRRYFLLFHKITLLYYQQTLGTILLEGELELDETQLFKKKIQELFVDPIRFEKSGSLELLKEEPTHL